MKAVGWPIIEKTCHVRGAAPDITMGRGIAASHGHRKWKWQDRYHGRTNRGILRLLTQALNDVRELRRAAGCVCDRGRWRVTASSVIFARRGSPAQVQRSTSQVDAETHHFRHSEAAGRGIPHEGRSSTTSLPFSKHPWDSSVACGSL